jgi:hypothetical protein
VRNSNDLFILGTGFSFVPFNNLNLKGEVFTNFSKWGFSSDFNYQYLIDQKIGFSIGGSNSFFQKDFYNFTNNLSRLNNFNFTSNLIPYSRVSFYYNGSSNNIYDNNSFNFSLQSNFNPWFNPQLNFQTSFGSNGSFFSTYGIGNKFNFPLDMAINFYLNENQAGFYKYLNLRVNFLKLKNFQFNLSESLSLNQDSLTSNLSLGGSINLPVININSSISYLYQNNVINNNAFSINTGASFRFDPYNTLNLNSNFRFSQNYFQNNFSVSYGYNFVGLFAGVEDTDISGVVFVDTNDNGIFDPEEKTLTNSKITFDDKTIETSEKGFAFNNLKPGDHKIKLDKESLPPGYSSVVESQDLEIYGKDNKFNIAVSNFVPINGIIYGNGIKSRGLSQVEVLLDYKTSSITDIQGRFNFRTNKGPHKLSINYETIPQDYIMVGKSTKNIEVKEDNDSSEFILNPVISLKGRLFYDRNKNGIFQKSEKLLKNQTLKISYINLEDDKIESSETTTDDKGIFTLFDLKAGQLKIESPLLKEPVMLVLPDQPGEIAVDVPADKDGGAANNSVENLNYIKNDPPNNPQIPAKKISDNNDFFLYKVHKGDTWTSISIKYFNNPKYVKRLMLFNKKKLLRLNDTVKIPTYKNIESINNKPPVKELVPAKIKPEFTPEISLTKDINPSEPINTDNNNGFILYKVKRGDTWSSIAIKNYKNAKFVKELIKVNRKKLLRTNDLIKIPDVKNIETNKPVKENVSLKGLVFPENKNGIILDTGKYTPITNNIFYTGKKYFKNHKLKKNFRNYSAYTKIKNTQVLKKPLKIKYHKIKKY